MGDSTIIEVGTIGVPVSDPDRALEFYVGTLGFEKRRDIPFGGTRWIEVAPPGATTTIALVPAGIPAGIRLFAQDADAVHKALRARGTDTDPEVMHLEGAPAMFAMRDPDGNTLIIVGLG